MPAAATRLVAAISRTIKVMRPVAGKATETRSSLKVNYKYY